MVLAAISICVGLALLLWSADRFVLGAASVAHNYGMPPLLIGMVIVGFGTSAPEMLVSALASVQGNPGLALGNAYGSNITNIALILGLTALFNPISVKSEVLQRELPILTAVTFFSAWLMWKGGVTRLDAVVLLVIFSALMAWSFWRGLQKKADPLGGEVKADLQVRSMPNRSAWFWLVLGLLALILSSRVLVWGAVKLAAAFGLSDLVIGLTIVAVGTSLPELASSLMAARKGDHEIALGNVIGSNLFNTLAVVGIAGAIQPIKVGPEVFNRDILVMTGLTISLFIIGYGFRGLGRINRYEGLGLLATYIAYNIYLIGTTMG